MIVKAYIKEFEKLGIGMFVHFGLYSVIGRGEWAKKCLNMDDREYVSLTGRFDPKKDWAKEIAETAKEAGCRYIVLTTRHHDGFSLYDTCGLNEYDTLHAKCGRDLVGEFTDACRKEGIVPFFYHTLLDWHDQRYQTDFPEYLRYLRASVELLCKNYGKIGGIWNEKHYVVKLETVCESDERLAGIPYGTMKRGAFKGDQPVSAWIRSGDISFLMDSVFAYSMDSGTLGLTLLRSPICGEIRLVSPDEEKEYDILSQGISTGKVRVDFDGKMWECVPGFFNPPVIIVEANHEGLLPCEKSFFSVDNKNVQ